MFAAFVLFWCIVFGTSGSPVAAYKTVVMVHGLLDHPHSMDQLASYIEKEHPGTNVTVLDFLDGWKSLAPVWSQVHMYKAKLQQVMEDHGPINLICYSQGGLICRGLLASITNHTVANFISLSAPLMGQYGDAGLLRYFFPYLVKEFAYRLFYTFPGQLISIGNYWNDPQHQEMFLNMSAFMPIVNNLIDHPMTRAYRDSFLRLKSVVLIGGPDDGVINPWQSSHFEFLDEELNLVPLHNQTVYQQDLFGLKTLDKAGRLLTLTASGVDHFGWHKNVTVFRDLILPHLD